MPRAIFDSGLDFGRLLRRDDHRPVDDDVLGLTELPSVNARLTVSPAGAGAAGSGRVVEARTYVEDLQLEMTGRRPASAEIVIARPDFPGSLHGEDAGTPYLLRWVADGAVFETTGRLMGRERIGPAVIGWRLSVTGPVRKVQRRRHARVEMSIAVVISVLHDGRGDRGPGVSILRGLTVNLSEGGVLAVLEPPAAPLQAPVIVRFTVADERFGLPGRVLRHQSTSGLGIAGSLATAVQFDTPDLHGDRLRPLLFAREINARRVGAI